MQSQNILLLLAYAIIANEYIHIEQLKFLDCMIGKSTELHHLAYQILLSDDSDDRRNRLINLKKNLQNESEKNLRRLRKNMVKLMCYDGEYDEKEKEFINYVFPDYEPPKTFIRRHISVFNLRTHRIFLARIFGYLLAKLFSKDLPYLIYSQKKTEKICMRVDEVVCKAFSSALELVRQSNMRDMDERLSKMFNDYNERIRSLNKTEPIVALVGKTKAGKSTLFSLLCGMGNEFIGEGIQRTTKVITAAHYHGIRIVDTPGLYAAAENGEIDKSKTECACKMADAVLFVMGDDTFSDELNFMNELADKGKPLTVLFNYKNNDEFTFARYWSDFKNRPDSWKDSKNGIRGWEHHLMQVAEDRGFAHVLTGKIHYAFLLAAKYSLKKGKNIPDKDKNIIKASAKEWKDIYCCSNYGQAMSAFFSEFKENFIFYRLMQYVNFSAEVMAELEQFLQERSDHATELESEYGQKLASLMEAKDSFVKSCEDAFQDKLCEFLGKELWQLDNEFDCSLYKIKNRKFEEYVIALYNRVSEEAYNLLRIIIEDKYRKFNIILGRYGIRIKPPEEEDYGFVDRIDAFKTQGSRNVLKSKDFYRTATSGLGIGALFANAPVGLGMMATSAIIDGVTGKKLDGWAKLTEERSGVRLTEVRLLFDKMYRNYWEKMEFLVQKTAHEIEIDEQITKLREGLDNSCKLKKLVDELWEIAELSNEALYSRYVFLKDKDVAKEGRYFA